MPCVKLFIIQKQNWLNRGDSAWDFSHRTLAMFKVANKRPL